MQKIKLSGETLDNLFESAVINIGDNNGYIEAYIDGGDVVLIVYGKHGDVVLERRFDLAMLRDKDASEQYREQQIDDNSWHV